MSNFRNSFGFSGSNPKIFLGSVEYVTIATTTPCGPMVKESMTLIKKSLRDLQWSLMLLELSITNTMSITSSHLNAAGAVVGTEIID